MITPLTSFALLFAAASPMALDEPQGPAAPDARLEELDLGAHWLGPQVTHEDLIGKVVIVELWGS